jgi:glycosyltransferase involved in cell wall biosynthesis
MIPSRQFPKVSICIPTFNGEEFLEETISSIEKQNYSNIEVIFSDDQSTDNTLKLIQSFQNRSEIDIRVIEHQPNGIGSNWNNSVHYANGEFIKFLFQDDLLEANCISEMVNYYQNNERNNVGVVYCNKELIGETNQSQINLHQSTFDHYKNKTNKELLSSPSLYKKPRNKIAEPPCILIKRSVFDEIGYFNESLKQSLDYEFIYRVMTKFTVIPIDQKLVKFRIHSAQTSAQNNNTIIKDSYLAPLLLLKKHFRVLNYKTTALLIFKVISGTILFFIFKPFLNKA